LALRNTIQMQKILNFLDENRVHPNAEEVFQGVRKELPSITLATVYRNLHKLADEGRVLKFGVNGELKFDGYTEPHEHCLCTHCGKVLDAKTGASENALKSFHLPGFKAECVTIMFFGLCSDCIKEKKGGIYNG